MKARAQRYVLFRVGDRVASLPSSDVVEVLPAARLERPPGSPPVLAGFLSLAGEPLAVLSGAVLFGDHPRRAELYAHILRLAGDRQLGLLVDRVTDVSATAESGAPVDPEASLNGLVAETLLVGGQPVASLDAGRLLLREEALRVAALQAAEHARLADWPEVRA